MFVRVSHDHFDFSGDLVLKSKFKAFFCGAFFGSFPLRVFLELIYLHTNSHLQPTHIDYFININFQHVCSVYLYMYFLYQNLH